MAQGKEKVGSIHKSIFLFIQHFKDRVNGHEPSYLFMSPEVINLLIDELDKGIVPNKVRDRIQELEWVVDNMIEKGNYILSRKDLRKVEVNIEKIEEEIYD